MRMRSGYLVTVLFTGLAGCVSLTPRAQSVQLYAADAPALASCRKLGRIKAEVSGFSQLNWDNVDAQAKNDLRDAAAAKWGDAVDAVALVTVDHSTTEATANGIGYLCAK